ncbi:hypothetical protein TcCL_ESM05627 [Trypanosoma cruzi]|nr:hypothetical protein TcCL_ESM05627 [Trypanosoma cruzi]
MTGRHMLLSTGGHWGDMMVARGRGAADTELNRTREMLWEAYVVVSANRKQRSAAHGGWFVERGCIVFAWSGRCGEFGVSLASHWFARGGGTCLSWAGRPHVFAQHLHLLLVYWLLAIPLSCW